MVHYSRRTGAAIAVLPPEQGRHLAARQAAPYRVDLLPGALCACETEVVSP